MKKYLSMTLASVLVCGAFAGTITLTNRQETSAKAEAAVTEQIEEKTAEVKKFDISMQIDNPNFTVGGEEWAIDTDGTTPVIDNGRTLVPIRAIIENMHGSVEWNAATKEATLTRGNDVIRLLIDNKTAYFNDEETTLDTAPTIINGRTMLPIRFIAESFGFETQWNAETKTITISVIATDGDLPVVYMTAEITPEALVEIYEQLGFKPEGNVAVKMSTGEPPNSNYLRPELIKDLVQSVNGTIVECNTAYGGQRAETALHKQVAKDHGFTDIAAVDIMDENGSMEIPVVNGERIDKDYVGKNLENYNSLISLAHFKGHAMAGFGGAIKNMSIGVASPMGKAYIHSGGTSTTDVWGGEQDAFCEAMADAAKGVADYFDNKVVYINVMNRISIDCDCDGDPAEPDMHDVGILASTDPVALDQACIDIIYNTDREESGSLIERIESRNGLHTLETAEKNGLGSREYKLVNID